jgi:uncharacterized protein
VDRIDYPDLVRRALLDVVRGALRIAASEGLPGDHHFYLAFRTGHPGVEVPASLRTRFPEEMTIVLQHQFWSLELEEDRFAVTLRFGGKPQRVTVPWEALTAFSDPGGPFAIRLDGTEPASEEQTPDAPGGKPAGEEVTGPDTADPSPADRPGTGNLVDLDAFRRKR